MRYWVIPVRNTVLTDAIDIKQSSRELDCISIEEARNTMGQEAKSFSDDEVRSLVYDLTLIARDYIGEVLK